MGCLTAAEPQQGEEGEAWAFSLASCVTLRDCLVNCQLMTDSMDVLKMTIGWLNHRTSMGTGISSAAPSVAF